MPPVNKQATKPAKATAQAKKPTKKPEGPRAREVIYPNLRTELYLAGNSNGPITEDLAKQILGWDSEPDYAARMLAADPNLKESQTKFGDDFLLEDELGNKVRCGNNAGNRPFTLSWSKALAKDILLRNWADSRNGEGRTINGETIIIGRTGKVLSAQHRLVGLILACQLWRNEEEQWGDSAKDAYYHLKWPDGPPTIESLVVFGVDESAETVRTLDNTRTRTLTDVLYTQTEIFGENVTANDRKVLARSLDYAIKFLWHRTGADKEAFSPKRTHSESLDFVNRHPKVLECVQFVHAINQRPTLEDGTKSKDTPLKDLVSPGFAAGLLYLMGCSDSDTMKYQAAEPPREMDGDDPILDWGRLDDAKTFWSGIAKRDPQFMEIIHALAALTDPNSGDGGSVMEKTCTIVKAWNTYIKGEELTEDNLKLVKEESVLGIKTLKEFPIVEPNGIDMGEPVKVPKGEKTDTTETPATEGEGEENTEELPEDDELSDEEAEAEGIERNPDDLFPSEDEEEAIERRKEEIKRQGLESTRDEVRKTKSGKKG